MKKQTTMPLSKLTPKLVLAASLAFMAFGALAQKAPPAAQYKYFSADGSLTYSDRPPPPDARVTGLVKINNRTGAAGTADELPFAVRDAVAKHPVVIYTAADCQPCTQVKAHLTKRGVPYSEKVLRNSSDLAAFKGMGFSEASFPAIAVGAQKSSGYESSGLDSLLDIAGYPKTARLPGSYSPKVENLSTDAPSKTVLRGDGEKETTASNPKPVKPPVNAKPQATPTIRF
jgi:glutaredoxin